ncbi:L-lactate permease [Marinithermofilum abyssi]|uniref:L-lactate permease n=1 Tax=Marinithermofilum abyssi TaxID=1571185 RepID=A0A8J2YDE3_9BACL|nr:lactate permease LctP family transporter [Marinithermofilum abyssi]GGE09448.1 L-lactate permease [Marinithermofilum abyssi]
MWTQVYEPVLGNTWLSALVAAIPIFFFFWALAYKRMKGHLAGLITVGLALLIAVLVYRMPAPLAGASFGYGFFTGLFPIGWIIINAVFLYKITVKTGQFDIIRSSIVSITDDHRLQALLIAFCFGAFLEGSAGFGTPVAISAALLTGLGFRPLYAAGICLIANTSPVAFGAIGIPIIVAGKTTGLDTMALSEMAGRQLPFLTMFVPLWLIIIMAGWKGAREVMPAILVTSGTFALVQFLSSNYLGPELPDVLSSLLSIVALIFLLKVWKPKSLFRFDKETYRPEQKRETHTAGQVVRAWSPFIVLTVLIIIWSIPALKEQLNQLTLEISFPILHEAVAQAAPIVPKTTPYAALYKLDWLASAGTAILLSCLASLLFVKMKFSEWVKTFGETVKELRLPLLTIVSVLGLAYVYNYTGMSATLGLAMANTGFLFPFFAPVLGWLGVFLTGSDTSSNALFGNLQKITANQIGIDPTLTVAANSTGGVTGKMISPQSIAVATASAGLVGKEGDLFRFTLKHSFLFLLIVSIITMLQAYVFIWMVP